MIDHDDERFEDAYRIDFRDWRIADIDNYFGGNSLFIKYMD
jgi:hypothetical protein